MANNIDFIWDDSSKITWEDVSIKTIGTNSLQDLCNANTQLNTEESPSLEEFFNLFDIDINWNANGKYILKYDTTYKTGYLQCYDRLDSFIKTEVYQFVTYPYPFIVWENGAYYWYSSPINWTDDIFEQGKNGGVVLSIGGTLSVMRLSDDNGAGLIAGTEIDLSSATWENGDPYTNWPSTASSCLKVFITDQVTENPLTNLPDGNTTEDGYYSQSQAESFGWFLQQDGYCHYETTIFKVSMKETSTGYWYKFEDKGAADSFPYYTIVSNPNSITIKWEYIQPKTDLTITSQTPIRFRRQDSDNTNMLVVNDDPVEVSLYTSKIWLGNIVFGIHKGKLYNWNNYEWNPEKNILFNVLSGDENSQTKISEVEFPETENWNENTQTLIRRQSQQQLIPKLLIDSKYLMNIRIPKTNKQQKNEDGYIIEKLKINDIENNYRLGAFPDVYPIHIKRFGGWHQSMISIADIDNYNPEADLLVLYRQEYDSHTVDNPYSVGVVKETKVNVDDDQNYGLKIIINYNSNSVKNVRICDFQNMTSPQVTINTKVSCYDITENIYFYHDKCYSNDLHLDTNEITLNSLNESYTPIVDSVLTTETTSAQINLCNVGDYAKYENNYFDIGEGYLIKDQENVQRLLPEHGAKIQLIINHSVFKENLVFLNDAWPSDNLLANDVICYSKILYQYQSSSYKYDFNGYINGHLSIDGCIPDTPIYCVGNTLEDKDDLLEYLYTNAYRTVKIEDDTFDNNNFNYQIRVNTSGYNSFTSQYFRFGINLKRYNTTIDDRLNNSKRNASKYKYDLVLWKNIKQ